MELLSWLSYFLGSGFAHVSNPTPDIRKHNFISNNHKRYTIINIMLYLLGRLESLARLTVPDFLCNISGSHGP